MSAATCAACGNEEPEGSRFCGACGTPFAAAERSDEPTLTCTRCGNREPEGSRFCGACGEPFAAPDPVPAPAPPPVAVPAAIEAAPGAPPGRRRTWIAGAAAAAVLVATGVLGAVLVLGDDDTSEAVTTEEQPSPETFSSGPTTVAAATLAETVSPRLQALAADQDELSTHLRSLRPGVESFAALRSAADALASDIVPTQGLVAGLAPNDGTEADAIRLLERALVDHLAYAEAIVGLPAQPRLVTEAQARAAVARAEQARLAYASLAAADPTLPAVTIGGADHQMLLAAVSAAATPAPVTRWTLDLVSLLVGTGPDDPPSQGRCFGPYTSRASLRVSGVVHRSGFIQCGDDANGDPGRATGTYRFSGSAGPAGSRLIRLTGQVAIDESSSSSQRGSNVSWTVFYDGRALCSATVGWSGARPSPRALDCRISATGDSGGFDVRRLQIQQVASPASSGSFWAGMLDPRIVVVMP
jgi:double zinc ribbon protein